MMLGGNFETTPCECCCRQSAEYGNTIGHAFTSVQARQHLCLTISVASCCSRTMLRHRTLWKPPEVTPTIFIFLSHHGDDHMMQSRRSSSSITIFLESDARVYIALNQPSLVHHQNKNHQHFYAITAHNNPPSSATGQSHHQAFIYTSLYDHTNNNVSLPTLHSGVRSHLPTLR